VKVKPADPGGLDVNTQTSALLGGSGATGDTNLAPAPEAPDPAALAAAAQQEQAPQPAPSPAPSAPVTAAAPAPPPPAPVVVPSVPETAAAPAPARQETAMNIPPPSATSGQVHNLAEEYNPPAARGNGRGRVRVQLAALDSHEAALREWDHLTHRMPSLFDGRHPIFAEAHVNGHIYWRVRTAGFASLAAANRFCDDVHAQGGACTVASF
jgi:hypothetical protein